MYVVKKILLTVLVLLGAATASFGLLRMLPGDPAEALAGPQATLEDVATVRKSLDLDRPLARQYATYMGNLARGDLGYSYRTRRPVTEEILARWPATLKLSFTSMLVAVLLGVPLGIHAARRRGKAADTAAMMLSFVGVSMPRSGWGWSSSSASRWNCTGSPSSGTRARSATCCPASPWAWGWPPTSPA